MISERLISKLARKGDYRGLIGLANEGTDTGYVNDLLRSVLACDRSNSISPSDESLGIVFEAGSGVGPLFEQEAERFFRKHGIGEQTREVFEAQAYRQGENPANLKYSRRDDHALLIGGTDEERYKRYVNNFRGFLVDDLGMPEGNIFVFGEKRGIGKIFKSKASDDIENSVSIFLKGVDNFDNIVIYYAGHGKEGYFKPGGDKRVTYRDWAEALKDHNGNMVFANESCYAESAKVALRDLGLLPNRILLLSASEKKGEEDIFSRYLMDRFRRGKKYGTPGCSNEDRRSVLEVKTMITPIVMFMAVKEIIFPPRIGANFDYLLMKFE